MWSCRWECWRRSISPAESLRRARQRSSDVVLLSTARLSLAEASENSIAVASAATRREAADASCGIARDVRLSLKSDQRERSGLGMRHRARP